MKNQRIFSLIGTWAWACFACVLFAACQNVVQPSNPAEFGPTGDNAGGKAAVSIAVLEDEARTVLPQVSLASAAGFTLLGAKDNGAQAEELTTFTSSSGTQVTLEPGSWDFILNATNSAGDVILQGTVEDQTIALSGANTVSFTMLPLESGQGSISVTVDYPASISRVDATLEGAAIESGKLALSTPAGGKRVVYSDTKAAGSYFAVFKFYDTADTLLGTVSELILVRGNVTSSKTITLAAADLKTASGPTGPTGLTWSGSWTLAGTDTYISNPIGDSENTWETLTISAATSSYVTVTLTASSESGYDYGYASTLDGSMSTSTGSYQLRVSGTESGSYTSKLDPQNHQRYSR